jgi:hypothetical protein
MKTKLFFILFAGICWTFAAQAQTGGVQNRRVNSNMVGVWVLDSVKVSKRLTDNTEVSLKYEEARNSFPFIFDRIEIHPNASCKVSFDGKKEVTLPCFLAKDQFVIQNNDEDIIYHCRITGALFLEKESEEYHIQMQYKVQR